METQKSIRTNSIRQLLLMVSAVCLLGFTGCSGVDAGAGKEFQNAHIGKMDPQPHEDIVAANRDSMSIE
jgi:hypothetical protein